MDSEDNVLAEEIRKAGRAREVLENEVFKDAVEKIDQALLAGMRNAGIADDKLRLRLLDKYEALHDLLDSLTSVVTTGLFAEKQIEQKSMYQRMKDSLHIN